MSGPQPHRGHSPSFPAGSGTRNGTPRLVPARENLKAIAPSWSSLLALPSNHRGQDLYARLGYEYAGPYRNTPDGPEFDLLLLRVGTQPR